MKLLLLIKPAHLHEVFGTGTAATISLIKELGYKDFAMKFDAGKLENSSRYQKTTYDIREGTAEDKYNWMYKV